MGLDAGEEKQKIERGQKELGAIWASVDRWALSGEAGARLWCLRPQHHPALFRGAGGWGEVESMLMLPEQGEGAGPLCPWSGHLDGSSGCLQGRRLPQLLAPAFLQY